MTTLEGRLIMQSLDRIHRRNLLHAVGTTVGHHRNQRVITTNAFARLCFNGKEAPDEQHHGGGKVCQFLYKNECIIYDARPFGCRCFFSLQPCEKEACAVVEPFLVTMNTVFQQFIEHVDRGGFFGNLNRVLAHLATVDKKPLPKHLRNGPGLSRNEPIPGLLVPPEHRERAQPIVKDLQRIAFGQ
jgi:Fe-S-cluster containining protein